MALCDAEITFDTTRHAVAVWQGEGAEMSGAVLVVFTSFGLLTAPSETLCSSSRCNTFYRNVSLQTICGGLRGKIRCVVTPTSNVDRYKGATMTIA